MPPSTGTKMREAGKKTGDYNNENEIKKLQILAKNAEQYDSRSIEPRSEKSERNERRSETTSRNKPGGLGADGKKDERIVIDKKRSDLEGKEKKSGSNIADKVPKKNAQRAKGSIAINKNKCEEESVSKKRPVCSADNLPRSSGAPRKNNSSSKDLASAMQKPKASEKSLRSYTTQKHSKEDPKEGDRKVLNKKKRSSWSSAPPEQDGAEVVEEEESQIVNLFQEPNHDNAYGCAEPPSSFSSSFFGKIQQGVKAYFTSRNSLKFEPSGDDKNKKKIPESEEGLQTGVGVSKGVKEENKKRNPNLLQYTDQYGINIKNSISMSESTLYNGPRLYSQCSKSGGQTNNSFDNMTKIKRHFRMMKRKNLYHPQKHYVRIQIPRKGYFYRSTVQHKNHHHQSTRPRLEPAFVPKNESKVQISGVATSSIKGPNFFKKRMIIPNRAKKSSSSVKPDYESRAEDKRLRRNQENSPPRLKEEKISFETNETPSFSSKYSNKLSSIVSEKLSCSKLQQEVGNDFSFNDSYFLPKGANDLAIGNKCTDEKPGRTKKKRAKKEDVSELSENSQSESTRKPKRKRMGQSSDDDMSHQTPTINYDLVSFSSDNDVDQWSVTSEADLIATGSSKPKDSDDIEKILNLKPNPSMLFIEQELGAPNENHYFLERLPDLITFYDDDYKTNYETIEELAEVINTFDNFDIGFAKPTFVYRATVEESEPPKEREETSNKNLENILTAKLMGDVDLHLELENYLKAIAKFDDTGSCKARTKNTLQQNHINYPKGENTFADFKDPNTIENKLGLSVSAGELSSTQYSQNPTVKEKFNAEDYTHSERLFDEIKIKSSPSFESAISDGVPPIPDKNENPQDQLFVYLDRQMENFAASQEYFESKFGKISSSRPSDEHTNVKKIRSENDATVIKTDHEVKSKSHIRRTFGEMSLQPQQPDITPVSKSVKIQNSLPVHLPQEYLINLEKQPSGNLYEKISPLEPYSEAKLKQNNKSSVLYTNSFYSTSGDSIKPNSAGNENDSLRFTNSSLLRAVDGTKEEGKTRSETVASEGIMSSKKPQDDYLKDQTSTSAVNICPESWTPSLQELIEIYNNVLRQNRKIRRCSIRKVQRCLSNQLISFIHDKIKEKMHKKKLIKCARESLSSSRLKISEIPKNFAEDSVKTRKKENSSQISEYVNMFQEILSSSLSLKQIAQMNNMMANLQGHPLTNCNSTLKTTINKNKMKGKEIGREKKNSQTSQKKLQTVESSSSTESKKKLSTKPKKPINREGKKNENVRNATSLQVQKSNLTKTITDEKRKPFELPESTELESVLKTYLKNPDKIVQDGSEPENPVLKVKREKFLINVKLSEEKVIVNGIQLFKSEKSISPEVILPSKKETSDLIVESITCEQIEKLKSPLKRKSTKPHNSNKNSNNVKKPKKPKIKEPKEETTKTSKQATREKQRKIVPEEKRKESTTQILMPRKVSRKVILEDEELGPVFSKYEYDHHQLKIQHPIEAIIESSESRISHKIGENCNEFLQSNQEDSKFHVEGEITKNETDVLADEVYLNSIAKNSAFLNFGCGEELRIPLHCTGSYLIEPPKGETGSLFDFSPEKIAKFTKTENANYDDTFSIQDAIQKPKKTKTKRIVFLTPPSTYFCYPYIQSVQGDRTGINKKVVRDRILVGGYAVPSHRETVTKVETLRKTQNKTKVVKKILSKGGSPKHNKTPMQGKVTQPKGKTSRPSGASKKPTASASVKKGESTKAPSNARPFLNSKVRLDDESIELLTVNINEGSDASDVVKQSGSLENFTRNEEIWQEIQKPEKTQECQESENDEENLHSQISNKIKKENTDDKHSEYRLLRGFNNYDVEEEGESNIAKRSFTSQNSSLRSDSFRRPTILIHARNDGSDNLSFPSLMVLSESFLKRYSSFALSRTKVKSLFKSHSDLKFYPGRVLDNPEDQTPFVTFVLTPKQKAASGLPDNQTTIVAKAKASDTLEENYQEEIEEEDEEKKEENPLKAVEFFIETLSASIIKACKMKKQPNKTKKPSQNMSRKVYASTSKPCRRLQALYSTKRRPYQDCQRRLLRNNEKKQSGEKSYSISAIKRNSKTNNWMIGNQNKEDEKENPRKNEIPFERILKREETGAKDRSLEDKYSEEPFSINNLNDESDQIFLSVEYLKRFKNALKKAEKLKNKELVIEAIEDYYQSLVSEKSSIPTNSIVANVGQREKDKDSERKVQMTKKTKKQKHQECYRNPKSVDSSKRKLKTVKIKIQCTQNKNLKKPKKIDKTFDQRSKISEINSRESFKSGMGNRVSENEETQLLDDSVIRDDESVVTLGKDSSVYFDAEDFDLKNVEEEEKEEEEEEEDDYDDERISAFDRELRAIEEDTSRVSLNSHSWTFQHWSFLQLPNTRVGNLLPIGPVKPPTRGTATFLPACH